MRRTAFLFAAAALLAAASDARLRLVTDEADAALAALDVLEQGGTPGEAQWERIFSSEGYRRLEAREASLNRSFTREDFKAFLSSDTMRGRGAELAETLASWSMADLSAAERRARAYLPEGADISATVYPVIKPRDNSFVFDLSGDPAIFLYLDPKMNAGEFENVVAHEFHHVGYAASCLDEEAEALAPQVAAMNRWYGALGEGLAMLAAAGSWDTHPHATSAPEDRARWDADVARYPENFRTLAAFFTDVKEGRLHGDAIPKKAAEFYGVQGPWYTVGWKMAALIEQTAGRAGLVRVMCSPRRFLTAYNEAVAASGESLPLWPQPLIDALPPE